MVKSNPIVPLTKKEIIQEITRVLSEKNKGTDYQLTQKDINSVLNTYFDVLLQSLQVEKEVRILEFGKVRVIRSAARTAINPKTKEKILVKEKNTPKFSFSKMIKEAVNTKFEG